MIVQSNVSTVNKNKKEDRFDLDSLINLILRKVIGYYRKNLSKVTQNFKN